MTLRAAGGSVRLRSSSPVAKRGGTVDSSHDPAGAEVAAGKYESWLAVAAPVVLAVAALAFALPHLWRPIPWRVDSFFYQAQLLELRGHDAESARREVFEGPLVRAQLAKDQAVRGNRTHRINDPKFVEYTSRFYRRRWSVSAFAAAIYPLAGTRSLQIVSIIGYVLCAPLIYLLLRLRFSLAASFLVALGCLALPTLRDRGVLPLTDSFGLAFELTSLTFGWLALRRAGPWLLAWVASIAALSLTRDATIIPIAASAWILLRERTGRAALVTATGIAAAVPALLLFGAPLRENVAYTINGFAIPHDTSWSFIAHYYPGAARLMLHSELNYLNDHLVTAILFVGGLASLFLLRSISREFSSYGRAGAVAAGCFVYVVPQYSTFRLELVLLPFVAIGLAPQVERAWSFIGPRMSARLTSPEDP